MTTAGAFRLPASSTRTISRFRTFPNPMASAAVSTRQGSATRGRTRQWYASHPSPNSSRQTRAAQAVSK